MRLLKEECNVINPTNFILYPQCFKITEKVSFKIESEASYIYILSGQKFIKNAKKQSIQKPEACSQTVLPDRSNLKGQKLVENAKLGFKKPGKIQRIKKNFQKIGGIRVQKMRHFGLFLKQCGLVFIIGWSTTWPDFIFRP